MAPMDEIERQLHQVILRMKEEREKLGLSQTKLSSLAGLSQNEINYIETGKRVPNLYTLLKICDALHLQPVSVFEEKNEEREKAREGLINLIRKYV
jgi:transcriptional regulator with XRE-family HTH domain